MALKPKRRLNQVNTINTHTQTSLQKNPVLFEYTGDTALMVTGNNTRKNYCFNFKGAVQIIDYNDASAMMEITLLKRIG